MKLFGMKISKEFLYYRAIPVLVKTGKIRSGCFMAEIVASIPPKPIVVFLIPDYNKILDPGFRKKLVVRIWKIETTYVRKSFFLPKNIILNKHKRTTVK